MIYRLTLVLIAIISSSIASPRLFAQFTPVHYWNRTSGSPSWHSSGNWTDGLPFSGDVVYFRNPTNGTVYITAGTGVMHAILFNSPNNGVGHVYAKFRGDPGHGLYAGTIAVGSTASRTAFVDLDRGTHRATSLFTVVAGSRLDIRANSVVTAPTFSSAGTVNLLGGQIQATSVSLTGPNSTFTQSGSTSNLTATNLILSNGATMNSIYGSINVGSLQISQDSSGNGGGVFNLSGSSLAVGSGGVLVSDGTLNYQLGQFSTGGGLSLLRSSEVNVASGRSLNFGGSVSLGTANSTSPVTHATFTGGGRIATSSSTFLTQQSSLVITNGTDFETTSVSGSSNNGTHRNLTVQSGASLTADLIEIGSYGGLSFNLESGGDVYSNTVRLRDGNFGSAGAIVDISGFGSHWNNTGHFQVGFGDSNSEQAYLSIRSNGRLYTDSLQIGDSTGSANRGTVIVDSNGLLYVNGDLTIDTGGTLTIHSDVTVGGTMSLAGGVFNHRQGYLVIDGGVFDNGVNAVRIGHLSGDNASKVFKNGASLNTNLNVDVGYSGSGSLFVESGSQISSGDSVLARNSGSSSLAIVKDIGSSWESSGNIVVGMHSNATLSVQSGGLLKSHRGEIGERGAGVGVVNVDGANSRWEITKLGTDFLTNGNLLVGEFGNGTLNITNGGTVANVNGAIATQSTSTGIVNVNGAGSTWDNSGTLSIGSLSGGSATLNIENGGQVTVADTAIIYSDGVINLHDGIFDAASIELVGTGELSIDGGTLIVDSFIGDLTQDGGVLSPGDSPGLMTISGDYNFHDGTVLLEIAGVTRGIDYDALDISGVADLNGTLDIDLLGYSPVVGDSFHFFDSSSFSGNPLFDFSGAVLGQGLVWNVDGFMSTGTISVAAVPEPSSFFLITMSTIGMLRYRRRQAVGVV